MEDITGLRASQVAKQVRLQVPTVKDQAHLQPQPEAESPVSRMGSFKWAGFGKSRSPTKASAEALVETPQSSPQRAEHDFSANGSRTNALAPSSDKSRPQIPSTHTAYSSTSTLPGTAGSSSHPPNMLKPARQDSSDNLKSFKVSLDDPAWKVLPAALKKYKINNDDWQNYAMFICYGSPGETVLGFPAVRLFF